MASLVEPDGLEQPRATNIVWRYQSLDKFYDLLLHRKLHFAQAKRFTDRNEFNLIVTTHDKRTRKNRLRFEPTASSHDDWDKGEKLKQRVAALKETTYVNTWSLGSHESYALWKIYLSGARTGVAIRTTVAKLNKALRPNSHIISAAKVSYTNTLTDVGATDDLIVCSKLNSYRYENEYRLYLNYKNKDEGFLGMMGQPSGMNISVNLTELIDSLYLSPFASSWFKKVLEETIHKLAPDLKVRVRSSAVRDQ